MTGHRRIKPCLFASCFDTANDRPKSTLWMWKKNLIVLLSLWSDDTDIENIKVFQKSHLGGTDQKSCSFWPAEALAKICC